MNTLIISLGAATYWFVAPVIAIISRSVSANSSMVMFDPAMNTSTTSLLSMVEI